MTEQEHLTKELHRRQAYFAESERLSHTGSFGWNVSTDEHFWSEETFRIFEFDPSATVSLPTILERVHPQDMPSVNRAIATANRAEGIELEFRLLMPDGRIKHLHVVGKAERGETGTIEVIGAVMDVTARKRTEIELRRSKAHLADAQRLSRTGSVGMEVATKRIFWSDEAARIYGYPPGTEPTPDLILQRSHPDDVGLLADVLGRAAQGGHAFDWEHRLLMPDGSIKHLHDLAHSVRDEGGNEEIVGAILDITERKVAEEAIRRSEAYLAEAQRLSHTGSFGWNVSTDEHFWSDETFRIFEFAPASKLSLQMILDRVHPKDMPSVNMAIAAGNRAEGIDLEFRILMPDGRIKYLHVVGKAERRATGSIEVIGAVTDITERKLVEEGLRQSEERFRLVLDSIGAHVMATTSEGELEFVNQPSLDYFGKTLEELKRWLTGNVIVHPDERANAIAVWRRAVEKGVSYDIDNRFRRSDGVYRWFHVHGRPERDAQGSIVRWYALLTDIDERKKAEQKLEAQEMELQQILDFAPQLIAVYGPNRERLHINRIALDYLGLSLEEWRRAPQQGAFAHPDDRARDLDHFHRALSTGSAYEVELRLRKSDGSYRWFLARYNPVCDDKGQVLRWYVACTDIDDRKRDEERLQQENVALREEIDKASMFEEIVGTSPALQALLVSISKVAPSDSTVLIAGETGTGKELVARAIHRRSHRSSRAFVSVNCAAVPRDLVASELFGHEKGAFTGAIQRRVGRFELAEGGTIFLDEVGELLPDTQVALLRVLQEREFERIGGSRPIHMNVRVIAATNRDLEAAVASGTFREDLYYRLNVFPLEMPSLRERREDIPLLIEYFIDRYARKAGKSIRSIEKKSLQSLQSYPWPGNIRELQNVIERSVILCETETLTTDESWLSQRPQDKKSGGKLYLSEKLAAKEREVIEEALRESQGRVFGPSGAAAKLGIARSTLDSKIQSLNINKRRFKSKLGS